MLCSIVSAQVSTARSVLSAQVSTARSVLSAQVSTAHSVLSAQVSTAHSVFSAQVSTACSIVSAQVSIADGILQCTWIFFAPEKAHVHSLCECMQAVSANARSCVICKISKIMNSTNFKSITTMFRTLCRKTWLVCCSGALRV